MTLYSVNRKSPEQIGKEAGVSGRTIRMWMSRYGIVRLGPAHLRKGKCAIWNIGLKRSHESNRKNAIGHLGSTPHNKGTAKLFSFNCETCQVSVRSKPYRKRRFCSASCRDKAMRRRGTDHFNFRGDASNERQRHWADYRDWRAQVIKKSDYKCKKCGGDKNLTAHHINPWSVDIKLRLSFENGCCLCWPCHRAFHREFGRKADSGIRFISWLESD